MEYNINTSTKYIPTKQEFIWRDLKLDSISADIYAIVLGYGAWSGTYDDFVTMTNSSLSVVKNRIRDMVENGVLIRSTIPITGNTRRTILVCRYTKDGIRQDYEIKALINIGIENLDKYYSTRSANVKAKKNSKRKAKKYIEQSNLDLNKDLEIEEELYRHLDI